jgi:hypothetical protein
LIVKILQPHKLQRGVTLLIVFILMLISAVLALSIASTAATELTLNAFEQYRQRAVNAAATGLEFGMLRLPVSAPLSFRGGVFPETYQSELAYHGEEPWVLQSSVGKFSAAHYSIDSSGSSAREAADRQVLGIAQINNRAPGFTQKGRGVAP